MVQVTLSKAVRIGAQIRLAGETVEVEPQVAEALRSRGLVNWNTDTTEPPVTNRAPYLSGSSDLFDTDLDVDVIEILVDGGYPAIASLSGVTEQELKKLKGIGAVRASEIVDAVKAHGQ